MLTMIACCDLTGFVACQYFLAEITGQDYLYLWTIVNRHYSQYCPRYKVIHYRATRHLHRDLASSHMENRWIVNIKQLYCLNAIEACFSVVRNEWRRNKYSKSLDDEVLVAVSIIQHFDQAVGMAGFYRNLIRGMIWTLTEAKSRQIEVNN